MGSSEKPPVTTPVVPTTNVAPRDNTVAPTHIVSPADKIVGPAASAPVTKDAPAISDDTLRKEFGQYNIKMEGPTQTAPQQTTPKHDVPKIEPHIKEPVVQQQTQQAPTLNYDPAKAKEALRTVDTTTVVEPKAEFMGDYRAAQQTKDNIRANKLGVITGTKIDNYQNYVDTVDLNSPANPMHDVTKSAYEAKLAEIKYDINRNPETKNLSAEKKNEMANEMAKQTQEWEPVKKQIVDGYVDGYGSQTFMETQKKYYDSNKSVSEKQNEMLSKYGAQGVQVLDKVVENATLGKYPERTADGHRKLTLDGPVSDDPEHDKRQEARSAYMNQVKKDGYNEQLENHGYDVTKTGRKTNYMLESHQSVEFMAGQVNSNETKLKVMNDFDKKYNPESKSIEYEGMKYRYSNGQVQERPVDKIKDIQEQINAQRKADGQPAIPVDGVSGPKTREAAIKAGLGDELEKFDPEFKKQQQNNQQLNQKGNDLHNELGAILKGAGVSFAGHTNTISAPTAHGQVKTKNIDEPNLA